ncbi:MAG: AbiJ-NTD4 domain-containing protein [Candidatus Paracaedibacter sp.]
MDVFFERQKSAKEEWPTVLRIDIFPINVRKQCWQAWENIYNEYHNKYADNNYQMLHTHCKEITIFLREKIGTFYLTREERKKFNYEWGKSETDYKEELKEFFLYGLEGGESETDLSYAFTVLELICNLQRRIVDKVNQFLRQGGIGYSFTNNSLMPFTDENLLETAVIPVTSLLNQKRFKDTYVYLQGAFQNYKEGAYQTAIDNCVKAFECLLKTIFEERGIEYEGSDTLQPLILKASRSNLFLDISQDKVTAISNLLKSLGDLRNNKAGHGGKDKTNDPKVVRFAIGQVTVNMLYIAETHLESCPPI